MTSSKLESTVDTRTKTFFKNYEIQNASSLKLKKIINLHRNIYFTVSIAKGLKDLK